MGRGLIGTSGDVRLNRPLFRFRLRAPLVTPSAIGNTFVMAARTWCGGKPLI